MLSPYNSLLLFCILDLSLQSRYAPPLMESPPIMLWRLQKVGSSTLLSILLSYAFRYNILPRRKYAKNSLCKKVESCFPVDNFNNTQQLMTMVRAVYARKYGRSKGRTKSFDSHSFGMSLQHEICYLDADLIRTHLPCAFHSSENKYYHSIIHELFMVREPVSRMVSSYYFWGELMKLVIALKRNKKYEASLQKHLRLGSADAEANDSLFRYHNNESTAPPVDIAVEYAKKLPIVYGNQKGPSLSFTTFALTKESAIEEIISDRMMTLVLERLDESLIVMRHYLGWSVADLIIALNRKTLSIHPSTDEWPVEGIEALQKKLKDLGEIDVYEAANVKLDQRIEGLRRDGVDIEQEIETLRMLRRNVTTVTD